MTPFLRAWIFALPLALPSAAANDPLAPLDFLVGEWSGSAAGAGGTDVFERVLDGHFLQRRSQSVTIAAGGKAQSSMQAQLTIYATGGDALAAIYFDSDGHVIHYDRVTTAPGERVEFGSDAGGANPRFRLTYSLKTRGTLHVKFEMAPPGQSTYRLIADADETATH